MKSILLSLLFGLVLISAANNVFADARGYVWTYEYMTMPEGMFEVEYYLTQSQPDKSVGEMSTWKHYMELEYGITNNFDLALYQTFKQTNTQSSATFGYNGWKIRGRYRLKEKNELAIDTLLYLEYIRDDDLSKPAVLEGKLVLAKDINNFNLAYNQIVKQPLETGGDVEYEYAMGINYSISSRFIAGIESKGNYTEGKYSIGPTIALRENKFWVSLGTLWGLNKKADYVQTRFIVGIPF